MSPQKGYGDLIGLSAEDIKAGTQVPHDDD